MLQAYLVELDILLEVKWGKGADLAMLVGTVVVCSIVAANDELAQQPQRVNESPYGSGWLFKIRLADKAELGELLARDAYAKSAGV